MDFIVDHIHGMVEKRGMHGVMQHYASGQVVLVYEWSHSVQPHTPQLGAIYIFDDTIQITNWKLVDNGLPAVVIVEFNDPKCFDTIEECIQMMRDVSND